MRTRESILRGGEIFEDEVLIPGQGEKSYLYILSTRVEEDLGDASQGDRSTDRMNRLEWLRDWIDYGAPWPSDQRIAEIQERYAEGEQVVTSKALSEDWQNRRYEPEKLWAYRPLKVEKVPEGKHPVDWFVNQKLEESGLEKAPVATARELYRRLVLWVNGITSFTKRDHEI